MRPLNFTTAEQTFAARKFLLERILRTFPRRRFELIGDTSNSDVISGYPEVAKAALTSSASCCATSPSLTTGSPTTPAASTASTAQSNCSSGPPTTSPVSTSAAATAPTRRPSGELPLAGRTCHSESVTRLPATAAAARRRVSRRSGGS